MTNYASVFNAQLPSPGQSKLIAGRLYGSASALAIQQFAKAFEGLTVVVAADSTEASQLGRALQFFLGAERDALLHFPDWETLPYDNFSPHQDIVSERLETLYKLPTTSQGILVIPVQSLLQRIPPSDYVQSHSLILNSGDKLNINTIRQQFERGGYRCVNEVYEHGEFAVRGSLIDVFPMGCKQPFRIDLFDDEVESIRTFEPESQRTIDKVDAIRLLPAREFPFTQEAISRFRQKFRAAFEGDPQKMGIYKDVSNGLVPSGIEYYLPLFFEHTSTLFDYLPQQTLLILSEGYREKIKQQWQQIRHRYEQRRFDQERPLVPPDQLFLSDVVFQEQLEGKNQILLNSHEVEADTQDASITNYATRVPDPVKIQARLEKPTAALHRFIENFDGRILICAESAGRREAILEILHGNNLHPKKLDDWAAFLKSDKALAITVGNLDRGLTLEEPRLAIIAEAQLFGEKAQQRRRRKQRQYESEYAIKHLGDLLPGTPVVHLDHGVGRYTGLQTLTMGGTTNEFLMLEYAGNDKLYVPVSSLHLISRYNGASEENAPLHKLGSDRWSKAKRKAAKRAQDVAAELLDIYAKRAARSGHSYDIDETDYSLFADSFPFEETLDQENAIDSVLADLRADQPMDRIVCGDVGFGKTEVAMRAAFAGVQANKQVAMLVPTTLLAQQHFENFKDRFADWPVKIEVLSRFKGKKEQDEILTRIASGQVDIVIGTHKLLSPDIRFKRLGLVIIDEEHRFGVKQKEQFKKLRSEVDILTLTATPIPRTLNMAMSGMRDLSIIATPPAKRLSVKTFVSEWNNALVQEACLRELQRGGQIYFLHNDVASIGRMADDLQELVPEATVQYAHGQMRESELERVMLDFYHQRFNLLVCTTIVESGIDIPSANTIIINRADKLGLAQLHQLRGRVGRSHHRAYAYMITPPRGAMTSDANKRLEAIASLEDLGSGFLLANHDLEIRGAGELLGEDQSGQIQEIGFTLYTELLERAVNAIKAGEVPDIDLNDRGMTEIDIKVSAILPDDYLPDIHSRLVLYKRIASAKSDEDLDDLQVEMIDRFGLLPDPSKMLFTLARLRLSAEALGIKKLELGPGGGTITFDKNTRVDPMTIVHLVQFEADRYRFDGETKVKITWSLPEDEDRIHAAEEILTKLQRKAS